MSPTSYQLLYPATYTLLNWIQKKYAPINKVIGAGDRGRTGTIGKDRRILSPVRLPIPPLRQMAPRVGLEPTAYRLTAECSTIELPWNALLTHSFYIITQSIYIVNTFLKNILFFKNSRCSENRAAAFPKFLSEIREPFQ